MSIRMVGWRLLSTLLLLGFLAGAANRSGEILVPLGLAEKDAPTVLGYRPEQIRHAYGFDRIAGTGKAQLTAVVVAYGSPSIEQDVAVFSQAFALEPARLTIAYPQGRPDKTSRPWGLETSLDVEWIHALAPGAPLLLVVARTAGVDHLLAAVDYAVAQGARVVLMSWGKAEFAGELGYESHFSHPRTVYVAPSGDTGPGVFWPAASPSVLAVGGTSLSLRANGERVTAEVAWSGSGGGTSWHEPAAPYQVICGSTAGGHRSVPDVAFAADPSAGVAVYNSTYEHNGWYVRAGTSFAATGWAALAALLGEQRAPGTATFHESLYQLAHGDAANRPFHYLGGRSAPAHCPYDSVTGLGTPRVDRLWGALLRLRLSDGRRPLHWRMH